MFAKTKTETFSLGYVMYTVKEYAEICSNVTAQLFHGGSVRLRVALMKHHGWVLGKKWGARANFMGANFIEANFKNANFKNANFAGAYLRNVNFKNANFEGANFLGTNFLGANFLGADFEGASFECAYCRRANFEGANFRVAYCKNADFRGANFIGANFRSANFIGANFENANLKNITADYRTLGYHLACPEEGAFIGWKKVGGYIIKLQIPASAKRSSATTAKCRASKVKVLKITCLRTGDEIKRYEHNAFMRQTVYEVGKHTYPDSFDKDRWNECSHGIHFFVNKQNAINY